MNQAFIDYQNLRKINLFSHIDFMNRWFNGIIDINKIKDKRGNVLVTAGGEKFVFRYAKFYGFNQVENGKVLPVCYKESTGDFWILHPVWITKTAPLRLEEGFKPKRYEEILERTMIYKASGEVMRNLIEKSRVVELNK